MEPGCCGCKQCVPVDFGVENNFPNPVSQVWFSNDYQALQDNLNENIIGTVTVPPPPSGYPNDYIIVSFTVTDGCIPGSQTITYYSNSTDAPLSGTSYDLGFHPINLDIPYLPPFFTATMNIGFTIFYPSDALDIFSDISQNATLGLSNSCGSASYSTLYSPSCFVAGTMIALSNGVTKAIEDVAVGDVVVGAFGELNTVRALHRPRLAGAHLCKINGEHTSTSHHPHIAADKSICCVHPHIVTKNTYGNTYTVINADGNKESQKMLGLAADRVQKLNVGTVLQTLTGAKPVTTIEMVNASPFTQLYHLVVDGSHTYTADGYAVTGWAREDDFNYDTWTSRTTPDQ
jgi:hypothetical protein